METTEPTKEITIRQSYTVDVQVSYLVPEGWTDEEIRNKCEEFPLMVTVDEACSESDSITDVTFIGVGVENFCPNVGDFDIL